MSVELILTHPGGSHKDEFLACSVLIVKHGVAVVRREPEQTDLDDPSVLVVDVGGEHDPARGNFDHHQFPRDHEPICALSLVLQDLGLYEDARLFCDWLEPAEWFDTRGAMGTAKWLGVDRDVLFKLNSPMDVTLLRRFARVERLESGDVVYEMMRWVGEDLLDYICSLRDRLKYVGEHAEIWELESADGEGFKVLFMPRTDPLPAEPSSGLERYLDSIGLGDEVVGLVYPDRRGAGYGLSRHNDDPRLEFTRIEGEQDVHFAHARGFVAKTSAVEKGRLQELVRIAWRGASPT
ncbi:MAG: MYG1 family protein [Verrucomicrobiota bacterium]